MATNVTMPQLGESVTEGTVGKWLKQRGDKVAKYEPLVEIITDKVNSEIPSPAEGTLLDVLVPEGETIKVGTLMAVIGAPGETAIGAQTPTPTLPHSAGEGAQSPPPPGGSLRELGGGGGTVGATTTPPTQKSSAATAEQAPTTPAQNAGQAPLPHERERDMTRATRLSPVVARLAAEHNVDVSQIRGTGDGGRVTKQDIEKSIAQRATVPPPRPQPTPIPTPTPQPPTATGMAAEELVALTPMRKAIAEHMVRSVQTAAHVTTVFEVDMSKVAAHRAANKDAFARQEADLTYTAYFVEVAARVLREQPMVNSSFTDKGVLLKKAVNIGVAVAVPEGLIVPVLKNADELNLLGVARAVNDLSRRARERRLTPEDVQGGTFTITNPGTGGSLFGTPIINQPQAAIMGVGAITKRPVVIDDAIAIRPMVYLSLSFDHRILDGADGDRFLAAVKRGLESYG